MKNKYRFFLKKKDEEKLPQNAKEELEMLRSLLKEANDLNYYHLCRRCGDDPPERLKRAFDKYYGNL